jgi:phage gp37-like protein
MPEPTLDFEFYAGGLEDGILGLLKTRMATIGVTNLGTYSGELDTPEALKEALKTQVIKPPCVLVSYAGGEDIRQPATSTVDGRILHYRHECSFGIVAVDSNPQGEDKRRRGKIFKMIAAVQRELTGRRLKKTVEDVAYLLNTDVFEPLEVIPIAKLPDMTAYGITIGTAFKWSSPDRTAEPIDVTDLVVGVSSLNDAGTMRRPPELPGVRAEVGS